MPMSPNNLIDIINKNKNKKLLATKVLETDPKILPIIPKLIRDNNTGIARGIENNDFSVNRTLLEDMHSRIKSVRQNNRNIIKLFPDIELSIQIIVSSILSPKKMTDIQFNYKLNKEFSISPTVSTELLELIKKYVNDNYELEDKAPEIIKEALFNSGACPYVILPESSVDEIINADLLPSYSAEEFRARADNVMDTITAPINLLAIPNRSVSLSPIANKTNLASYLASENYVNLSDNVNLLRFSKIKDKISSTVIRDAVKRNSPIAAEALDKINYLDIFRQKQSTNVNKKIEFIKPKSQTKRRSIGKPLVIKIPTESILPVFVPGSETEHLCYFVLLDESGKPLNSEIRDTNVSQLNSVLQQNSQSQLSPAQKAYNSLVADSTNGTNVSELFQTYKDILEKQIYDSVKNGLYGSNVEIANKNDIYFIMFTRALANQKTNLLCIPSSSVVYYAFQYNELGVGKSLLENMSILSSLRAITLFSRVMAYAKQAIDVTKVNISLDPNDPDPEKTIEQIQDSAYKLRQNLLPVGTTCNPVDLINWIQRAGLQFAYSNNPLLPNVSVDFENVNLQHTVPDSALEEDLRKQMIQTLGLTPETVDNGFSPEFATTVVNNNILLSKRIALYSKTFTRHLNKFHSCIIYADEELRTLLREALISKIDDLASSLTEEDSQLLAKNKEAFIDNYVDRISDNLIVELPKPDNTNLVNLSAEYDLYKENLDKILDSVISTEILPEDISGDLNTHVDTVRNVYKHYLLRKWMSDNSFYPEALDALGSDKELTESTLSVIADHLAYTIRNSDSLLNAMQKFKVAVNKDLENVEGNGSEDTSSSSGSSDDSDTSNDAGDGGDGVISSDSDLDLFN